MSKVVFKAFIYFGVAGFLLATVGGVIYVNFLKEPFDFEHEGKENIGVVTRANLGRSLDEITHYVERVPYRVGFKAQLPGLTIGEKFYVLYNPEDPEEAQVQLWRPLFLPNESIGETVGEITCVSEVKFGSPRPAVCFEYVADDEPVNRLQELPMNYQTHYPDLVVGQHYEVEYWQENPKRAIIYLDRPVKE